MRRKRRKWDAEERPSRKRRALRHIEDREWEEELRYVDSDFETEDEMPAWPDEDEILDESDWAP